MRRDQHQPVLLEESVSLLGVVPGCVVVDGTLGGGGHAERILERSSPDGVLVGLDLDTVALAQTSERLQRFGDRFRPKHASFRDLTHILQALEIPSVDAVLFDLGVSSPQLDIPERGFRFASETAATTPLDMRLDQSRGPSAADLLREASATELEDWFRRFGELPGAARLARSLVATRKQQPLKSAADLLRVLHEAKVGRGRRHHPATLVFQALRIAVNDELGALAAGLEAAVTALRPGGRLAVISYHSLEDRLVKLSFRDAARGCVCPPRMPVCCCGQKPRLRILNRRVLTPQADEIRANPRARSAKLRVVEKLAEAA